jgi:hypothetical protein
MQRQAFSGPDTRFLKHFITMNDPRAPDHFLRDVSSTLEGKAWRWTGQRPLLKLVLPSTKNMKLIWDFGIPQEALLQTGPLTIRFLVNGRQLDQVVYDKAGAYHFEKPVAADWLVAGDNIVGAELDKVYIAEADKARLGVTLAQVGFAD